MCRFQLIFSLFVRKLAGSERSFCLRAKRETVRSGGTLVALRSGRRMHKTQPNRGIVLECRAILREASSTEAPSYSFQPVAIEFLCVCVCVCVCWHQPRRCRFARKSVERIRVSRRQRRWGELQHPRQARHTPAEGGAGGPNHSTTPMTSLRRSRQRRSDDGGAHREPRRTGSMRDTTKERETQPQRQRSRRLLCRQPAPLPDPERAVGGNGLQQNHKHHSTRF